MTQIEHTNGKGGPDAANTRAQEDAIDGPDDQLVDVSYAAIINAPVEMIDIPAWCFSLPDHEYQACSPAHIAAGFTTTPDGKRMSINVEMIGATILVQHYVERIGRKDHLLLESLTDVFTSTGRSAFHVTWEMRVRAIDGGRSEFINRVSSSASKEFLTLLAKQGVPFTQFRAQRQPASTEHVRNETPLFAASIERAALKT